MTINITYFVHGTTTDNEKGIATGWNPGELSELGRRQSIKLKEMIKDKNFDVVFCSDLARARDSAVITFGDRDIQINQDKRLRECNYGILNGDYSSKVNVMDHIDKSFPEGESARDVEKRVRNFLKDLLRYYPDKNVAFVAHREPQLALDVITKGKTWEQAIKEDWRLKTPKEWKPGWVYIIRRKQL